MEIRIEKVTTHWMVLVADYIWHIIQSEDKLVEDTQIEEKEEERLENKCEMCENTCH